MGKIIYVEDYLGNFQADVRGTSNVGWKKGRCEERRIKSNRTSKNVTAYISMSFIDIRTINKEEIGQV